MPRYRLPELPSTILLFAILMVLVALRAGLVDNSVGTYIDCRGCFHSSVLQADLFMFWSTAAVILAASFIRADFPGRLLHLTVGLLIVAYIIDLIIFRLFNTRLFLSDLALFITEPLAIWDQFSAGMGGAWIAIAITLAVFALLAILFLTPPVCGKPARLLLAGVVIISLFMSAALEVPPYVNDWATGNFLSANLATSERVHYSQDYESALSRTQAAESFEQVSASGPQSGRNVVIVILESWSNWHSLLFDGFHDWTPNLDATAARGLRFTNFHSIGFSTDKGLVGILAGRKLWSPFLHWFETPPFHSMWGIEMTLPRMFTDKGYEAAFLTTGPLSLYKKGEWLSDLGFQHVEGREHPFYRKEKRYAFRSASDNALYRRALQWIQSAREPYLLVLETVTTHQPYRDPDSGERSLEKAMRYADREFGVFFEALEDSGFLQDGLLVVVSDHRSMTPVPAEELERFGAGTFSRVPVLFLGKELEPGTIENRVLAQNDLMHTFQWWLSGTARLDSNEAVMLDAAASPEKCAFHGRGDQRGLLEVVCPSGHGQIRLEGDRTRFVQVSGLDQQRQQTVLHTVAVERLEGLRRHRQNDRQ